MLLLLLLLHLLSLPLLEERVQLLLLLRGRRRAGPLGHGRGWLALIRRRLDGPSHRTRALLQRLPLPWPLPLPLLLRGRLLRLLQRRLLRLLLVAWPRLLLHGHLDRMARPLLAATVWLRLRLTLPLRRHHLH